MKQGDMQLDPEAGKVVVLRESSRRGCFWPALCAVAMFGLVVVISYLVLVQQKGLQAQQDKTRDAELAETSFQAKDDLQQLMKQVGYAERPKIAAHLIALSSNKEKEVIWQDDTDTTLTEGVDFKNNGLVIRTPGQYFVYTQVVFHGKGCQDKPTYLSHNVTLLSASYPEENLLLKATKSICHYGTNQQHWYKTSYQGAIFQFAEGDQIFSRVSERVVHYVDRVQGKTFFGIFAL